MEIILGWLIFLVEVGYNYIMMPHAMMVAHGIHGDLEQPGQECRLVLKRRPFGPRLHECIMDDVLSGHIVVNLASNKTNKSRSILLPIVFYLLHEHVQVQVQDSHVHVVQQSDEVAMIKLRYG